MKGQENELENEEMKEYWTEHRTTLMAYQAQYVYEMRPRDEDNQANGHNQDKKKSNESQRNQKKKKNYSSGFVFADIEQGKQIVIQQLLDSVNCVTLKQMFASKNLSEDEEELRTFIKLMLEMKHEVIVKQFCEMYNIILKEMEDLEFEAFLKEEDRFYNLNLIKDQVKEFIDANPNKFQYFTRYLKNFQKATMDFILATAYCFVAEKFYFNINEFFSEAFDITKEEKKPQKKNKLNTE